MIKISILSIFPQMFEPFVTTSLVGKAVEKKIISFDLINMMDLTDPGQRVDAPTIGPGPGMILKPELIEAAIKKAQDSNGKSDLTIFFSPAGEKLTQPLLKELLSTVFCEQSDKPQIDLQDIQKHLVLVCARYEGMDQRVEDHFADKIISIGDYVLMGGELPAQVFLEGLIRLFPKVLGNAESIAAESFQSPFLDHPSYALPQTWKKIAVPEILSSGNHAKIEQYRKQKAIEKTVFQRFDWIKEHPDSQENRIDISASLPKHYAVVMYTDILVKHNDSGTTSIKSLDLHDIARSAISYGIEKLFIVTPLIDQQKIATEFLSFWTEKTGRTYNHKRFEAISRVVLCHSFTEVIEQITALEKKKPIKIATSAKPKAELCPVVDYHDQGKIFQKQKPILLIFGTGQGLSPELIKNCDYCLIPVGGLTAYNHLSVRAAAAIVFDRWIGINPKLSEKSKNKS
jgi:tRNA (guanine37-N1)-methyltransferase